MMRKTLSSRASALALTAFLTLTAGLSVPAHADVEAAFRNLLGSSTNVSVNEPGHYSSQARHSFVAGGLDVRFPSRRSPALFSVTPYQLNAGCGGISVYFGGFSFISGEEIKQLIQSVAQNAVGVAVELVMTTLCGPCAHVMQVMRGLAKDAARTAIDSCEMARALMERSGATAMLGADRNKTDKTRAVCASGRTEDGSSSDWISAISDGLCNGVERAVSSIEKLVTEKAQAAGLSAEDTRGLLCDAGARCNTVWRMLNETNLSGTDPDKVRAKVLIMNVIGTNVVCGDNEPCKTATGAAVGSDGVLETGGVVHYPPRLGNVRGSNESQLDMQEVFHLYMCGTNWEQVSMNDQVRRVVQHFCTVPARAEGAGGTSSEYTVQINDRYIWDCDASDLTECLVLRRVRIGDSSLQGSGYLPFVANLLQQGVEAVRKNERMPDDVIRLIQVTPVPLYQAINAAAVYPDAGAELIAVLSTYVAQLLTYADIREAIREAERFDRTARLSDEDLNRFYAFLGGMRATTEKAQVQIAQSLTIQQTLMEQIRQINLAMQREVMTEELVGHARYGTAVTEAAQSAAGGQ